MTLGIIAFYAMVIVTITSYLRNHLNHWFWRLTHYLGIVAFLFIIFHGLRNGTDLKAGPISAIYLIMSMILLALYLSNIFIIIAGSKKENS